MLKNKPITIYILSRWLCMVGKKSDGAHNSINFSNTTDWNSAQTLTELPLYFKELL